MVIEHVRLNSCIWCKVCLARKLFSQQKKNSFILNNLLSRILVRPIGLINGNSCLSSQFNHGKPEKDCKNALKLDFRAVRIPAVDQVLFISGFRGKGGYLKERNDPLMLKSFCGTYRTKVAWKGCKYLCSINRQDFFSRTLCNLTVSFHA